MASPELHYDDEALLRYRFDTMDPLDAEALSRHLRTCTECATRYAELGQQLDRLAAYDAEAELPEGLPARVLEQVRGMQREQQAAHARQEAEAARTEAEAARQEAEAAAREAEAARAAAQRLAGASEEDDDGVEPAEPPAASPPVGGGDRPGRDQPFPGLWAWLGLAAGAPLRAVRLTATLAALAGVVYLVGGFVYYSGRQPTIDTRVSGEESLVPGSRATLLVRVLDRLSKQPVANAEVQVALRGPDAKQVWKLFEGKTNKRGLADPTFNLPDVEDGDYRLEVLTRGAGESDRVEQPIRFHRAFKVHLSTDKPLYQPGQTIHIRSLVLQQPTLVPPAGRQVTLEALDPKGTRVMREKVEISKFGVAAHALELADDLRLGQYTIRAIIDGARSETKVKVARYTLPKFKITVKPDKPFYLAGETLRADVQARYFFGKPVGRAAVRVVLFKPDGAVLGQEIQGKADAGGSYSFSAELPPALAAAGKPETVMMEVAIKDVAGQEERKQQAVTVTRELLQMEVIPEGGELVAGMENTLFVLTTTPTGDPVAAKVDLVLPGGQSERVTTHDNGLGLLRYTPRVGSQRFQLRGEDRQGRRASRMVDLAARHRKLLVATEKAFHRPGDTVHLAVQAIPQYTSAVVEGLQEGQTVFRARFPLEEGKGAVALDLPQGILGTVRLDVQGVDPYDVRSPVVSRRIVVSEPRGLTVSMTSDKETFRPGAQAKLRFKVVGPDGEPKAAAIGLYVVDESVFALAASRPALARAFFLLERSMMKPRHNLSAPEALTASSWGPAEQAAGRLLLSLDRRARRPSRFVKQTYDVKVAGLQVSRQQFEENAMLVALGLAGILLLVLVVWAARRLPAWAGGVLLAIAAGIGLLIPLNMLLVFGALIVGILVALAAHYQATGRLGWALTVIPALGVGAVWLLTAPTALDEQDRRVPATSMSPVVSTAESRPEEAVSRALPRPPAPQLEAARAPRRARPRPRGRALGALADLAAPAKQEAKEKPITIGAAGRGGKVATAAIPRRQVRVRRYFPETMYVHPELVTDENGVAELTLPVADSITEWRVSALASSADGKLGAMNAPLKVFQDFFVDLDMPVALVRGDEVSIPVAVYNYLTEPQTVRLELKQEPWFETVGPGKLAVRLAPGGVDGREVRIRVVQAGRHRLTMRADGTRLSDALARELMVSEAGQERSDAASGTLLPGETVRVTVQVPDAAVPGSARLLAKLYPSRLSSALDGLQNALRMPHGCFEQTSSATYPNVLIYDYLKRAGKLTPAFEKRARRLIAMGYQRLLRFEVRGGGFEWFGRRPANQVLTAYGLMEFRDMSRVFPVDEKLIQRTQRWLISRQGRDGSWQPDRRSLRDGLWRAGFNGKVMVTAYIAWALAESGYRGQALTRAMGYLSTNLRRIDDAYTLALALATAARFKGGKLDAVAVARRLEQQAQRQGKLTSFKPARATAYYGRGRAGTVETTALAAYALGVAGQGPQLVQGALSYLAENRDYRGTWHSTQGTILALRALLSAGGSDSDQQVAVRINGQDAGMHRLKAGSDQPVLIELGPRARQGVNVVELKAEARATFQVVATYTLPWREKGADEEQPLSLKVDYDRTRVRLGGIVPVQVRLTYRRPEASGMALLALGQPAGLSPLPGDLQALVQAGTIARYELAGDKINLYIDGLTTGATLDFKLRFKAGTRVRTKGVGSLAYLYYHPEVRASAPPAAITVN